jgi:sarcosine oxidase delta subunit
MFVGVLPVVEVELIECPSCGNVWEGKFEYEGETTSIYEI